MKVVNEYPPNYEAICEAIPGVKEGESIIFTYGDTVYAPNTPKELSDHLWQHEATHVNQQKQMGVEEWWAKYLVDPAFRLEQELQAYRVQYNVVKRKRNWQLTEHVLNQISRDLAGDMYGNILTKAEARKLITRGKR